MRESHAKCVRLDRSADLPQTLAVESTRMLHIPVDIFGTVVGESPDCLLLSGTVVGENPDYVCWDGIHKFKQCRISQILCTAGEIPKKW